MDLTTFPTNREDAAEDSWVKIMASKFRNGVYKSWLQDFQVFADQTGLQVKVRQGQAFIGGFDADLPSQQTIVLDDADASNPRIDRVILRLDRSDPSTIELDVLTGTPAISPSVPTLTVTSSIIELPLAQVRVGAGAGTILLSNITDERTYTGPRGMGTVTPAAISSILGKPGASGFPADALHEHPVDVDALRKLLIPAGFLWGAAMGGSIPSGWLPCDGRTVSRTEYNALWLAIGATYGAPDGSTFSIPDYRGKFLRGTMTNQPTGQESGSDTYTLTGLNIPWIEPLVDGDGGNRVVVTGGGGTTGLVAGAGAQSVTFSDIDTVGYEFPAPVSTLPRYRAVQWCIKAH